MEDAQEMEPTGALMDRLDAIDVEQLTDDQALSMAVAAERLAARAFALQARALGRFSRLRPASFDEGGACAYGRDLHRYAPDELGCALGISRRSAGTKLDLAYELTERLPGTLAALHAGRIDQGKARLIAQNAQLLEDDDARRVEQQVLPRADRLTHAKLRAAVERAAARVDPELAASKHRDNVANRHVSLLPTGDGVSDLWARLPAEQAAACYDRVSKLAEQAKTPDDVRTCDQRRADVLVDLLLGTATGGGYQAQIVVLTRETSLLRLDEESGELVGSGPLPAAAVRRIAEQHPGSVWRRLLTDPVTGSAKDLGRTKYRPSAALDEFVRMRAQVCYFPGCARPAHRCDLDHLEPFANGGRTDADSLGPACRHHHPLKDGRNATWQVTQPQPGIYQVTSPTGRTYLGDPPPLLEPQVPPFHPPPT